MTPEERTAHLAELLSVLLSSWRPVRIELEYRHQRFMHRLIVSNDEGIRGRIQELEELLKLPQSVEQELDRLKTQLPDQAGMSPLDSS